MGSKHMWVKLLVIKTDDRSKKSVPWNIRVFCFQEKKEEENPHFILKTV
jgi:hypothetical protein